MRGVKENTSTIIAEMGLEMERFPGERHRSSWAGMSPGNNESAAKKKLSSTTYGNKCLKTMLIEFAWSAFRTKDTYLRSKYYSLVGRRGKKMALVALGHKILFICYYILKYRLAYKELGGDYLDQRRKNKITRSYIKRLNHLGYEVILKEAA
jgi:transposase